LPAQGHARRAGGLHVPDRTLDVGRKPRDAQPGEAFAKLALGHPMARHLPAVQQQDRDLEAIARQCLRVFADVAYGERGSIRPQERLDNLLHLMAQAAVGLAEEREDDAAGRPARPRRHDRRRGASGRRRSARMPPAAMKDTIVTWTSSTARSGWTPIQGT